MKLNRIVVVTVIATLALVASVAFSQGNPSLTNRQRGLVVAGLTPAANHLYKVDGTNTFTHGPDPAPDGVDVTQPADLTASDSPPLPCVTDGVSGPRVQAVYVVASDMPDRYDTIAPLIRTWANDMDYSVNTSAAETGGSVHIRFYMPNCTLDVSHIVVSSTGDDTFGNTINELKAQGYNATNRHYVIWGDASVYCGIGQVGQDNAGPYYGRVDQGCWSRTDHNSALHELIHTFGAVAATAPHFTGGYHCTDEYDAECYNDGATMGIVMTYPCPSSHEWLLDCNHDDYFSTGPLDSAINVADSIYFSGGPTVPPSPSPTTSPSTVSPTPSPTPTASPTCTPPKSKKCRNK